MICTCIINSSFNLINIYMTIKLIKKTVIYIMLKLLYDKKNIRKIDI